MEFTVARDGFCGKLYKAENDRYPGRILIVFSGSDSRFTLTQMLAEVFCRRGLTVLAFAYVMEEGLPDKFYHVPIDTLEEAARRMHQLGYEKVGLWGISKGAELALTAASLLPELVNAVVAVAPINTVCQGFAKERGISVMPGSTWTLHRKEVPYTPFGLDKFPVGQVIWDSLRAGELTMYELYRPMVERPASQGIIRVEEIGGPLLLISSKMDTMWPSELAAQKLMDRLKEKGFAYPFQHLSYGYGSHLFVPMELRMAKFFKAERKHREESRAARMDALEKTLKFVGQW